VNTPNCEIIRGEVSRRKIYIGGMSYFSRGRFRCGLNVGANWAEAVENAISEIQIRITADNSWLILESLFFIDVKL
jgi:hypothetical protein